MTRARRSLLALVAGSALVVSAGSAAALDNPAGADRSAAPAGSATTEDATPARQAERLDRGLLAVPTEDGVLVSWRLFGTDPQDLGFHLFRDGRKINRQPIRSSTNFLDPDGAPGDTYELMPLGQGGRGASETTTALAEAHFDIPLNKPAGGTTPDGGEFEYRINDASVGDLNGDGQYDIVVKWEPTNAQDNSRSGYTGEVFLDAYTLEGEQLWRLGLGPNIRAGAHYTQFLVYDFDGNGRSEVVLRTADGTVDGLGQVIGDPEADYRNSSGYVLTGPEFLTVFDGLTGEALETVDFEPARGDICQWGDCYGNRGDRFLAAVAYLDGERPSIMMSRGYYEKTVLAAYDWRDGELTQRWIFDSDEPGNGAYARQGNHNLSVGDVDGDGRDEIVFGQMTVDDDGTGLYSTGLGHGDAMHLGNLDPSRDGLEVFGVQESSSARYGLALRDAGSGEVLWGEHTGRDTGRGTAGDIDPRYPGAEAWAVDGEWNSPTGWLVSASGELISNNIPPANFVVWWDGDLGREILDHDFRESDRRGVGRIDKWDWENETLVNLLTPTGTQSINDTKGNPSLQADILGDWREEVLWPTEDDTALRVYTTTYPTEHRITTLMHDPIYRLGVAWQNVAYNQPPHTSFFLGFDMETPDQPNIYYP
ncbi:rhamnogalacturonan lyase [Actinoalloteichus spitiensis]|uniref:rhamnogalacturonan lyase n=1 Tax=Actinoalloteichus spitiensis TaxID=252394 RepID=UPI000A02FD3A|nr:rhamnogalacturonan lyase [Actinoalloteichus spitiensis]